MKTYTNPITGHLKPAPNIEIFQALFSPEVRDRIQEIADIQKPDALVCYENVDLCSSNLGHRTCAPVGPNFTLKTLEDAAAIQLGDTPSQFQYPTFYLQLNDSE